LFFCLAARVFPLPLLRFIGESMVGYFAYFLLLSVAVNCRLILFIFDKEHLFSADNILIHFFKTERYFYSKIAGRALPPSSKK